MLKDLSLDDVLFLDIETVPAYADFDQQPDRFKTLWEKKAELLRRNEPEATPDELYKRAGIYAEFGKIVCISCGFTNGNEFRIKSYYGDDEKILLQEFADLLNRHYSTNRHFCIFNSYSLSHRKRIT